MSNLKFKTTFTDYAGADKFLGNADERVLGHNTRVRRLDSETIAVRYHETDIVTYAPDFTLVDCGGWATVTTTNRLHMLTPGHVRFNKRGESLLVTLTDDEGSERVYDLVDGPLEV